MSWDERALERAHLYYPEPLDHGAHRLYPLGALRDGKRDAFVRGAAWQREKLAVEEGHGEADGDRQR